MLRLYASSSTLHRSSLLLPLHRPFSASPRAQKEAVGLEPEEFATPRGSAAARFGQKRTGSCTLPLPIINSITKILSGTDLKTLQADTRKLGEVLKSTSGVQILDPSSPLRGDDRAGIMRPSNVISGFETPEMKPAKTAEEAEVEKRARPPRFIEENTERFRVTWGRRETLAYTASYAPSAYACVHNVLHEVKRRLEPEGWVPRTILDFGCGPGTAMWAAEEVWGEEIQSMCGVDVSSHMLTVAEEVQGHTEREGGALTSKTHFQRYLSYGAKQEVYDMVMASHVLGDIAHERTRHTTLQDLWERTKDVLVIVERGTPEGFRILETMREHFLETVNGAGGRKVDEEATLSPEAHILGPCPHEHKCPKAGGKMWCHFPQRVQRPAFMMKSKGATKNNWEDRKYSYLILRRGGRPSAGQPLSAEVLEMSEAPAVRMDVAAYGWPRMVNAPMKRDGHVLIDTCVADGTLERMIIPKSQGKMPYYDARKSQWGDLFPHSPKRPAIKQSPKLARWSEVAEKVKEKMSALPKGGGRAARSHHVELTPEQTAAREAKKFRAISANATRRVRAKAHRLRRDERNERRQEKADRIYSTPPELIGTSGAMECASPSSSSSPPSAE